MSELQDFLSWCAKASGSELRDSFGRSMSHASFPYGQVSWWIHEYEQAKRR